MERSWRQRAVVSADASTIADGIAIQTPCAEAVANLADTIEDILLVDDSHLINAMRLAHRELGVVIEPSGAAGLAGLMVHPEMFRERLVATVLTGGNLTPEQMHEWLG
jgi:threonine dehydratase